MENKMLNEKESLYLITQMIRNTQNRLEENSGRPFLIFGYLSIVMSVIIWYAFYTTGNYQWNYLWFLIPVIGWPLILGFNKQRRKYVTTYLDRIVKYVWIVLGISICLTCSMSIYFWNMESMFFTAMMLGVGVALSGLIIRIQEVMIAGFLGMWLSLAILFLEGGNQLLVFALLFLVMLVIPGHILNYKSKKRI